MKRDGHSTVKVGDYLYMWSGDLSGVHDTKAMDVYHLPTGAWDQKPTIGTPPPGTWAYSSIAIEKVIYYFGGFGNHDYHNSLYSFNVDTFNWRELSPSSSDYGPMMKGLCGIVALNIDDEDYFAIIGGSRSSSVNTRKQPDAQYSADGRCNEIHYYRISSGQ